MKQAIQIALANSKEMEGFREKVYKDTNGHDTIGFGFRIDFLKMCKPVAELQLYYDLNEYDDELKDEFQWYREKPPVIRALLMEMLHNMGMGGLKKFKNTLKYIEHNEWDKASVEILSNPQRKHGKSLIYYEDPRRAMHYSNLIKQAKEL